MLLQELRRYAESRGLIQQSYPFYAVRPVRYVIDLDRNGHPTSPVPLDRAEAGAKGRGLRGKEHLVPSQQRTAAAVPLLLCDTAEYLFGRADEGGNSKRAAVRREAMLALVRACATETKDTDVLACLSFLDGDPTSQIDWPVDFAIGDAVTFSVDAWWSIAQRFAIGGRRIVTRAVAPRATGLAR
mgnify:CR=1 FL=1